MSAVRGERLDDLTPEAMRTAAAVLLENHRDSLESGGDVVLLPDAHYPFHPTTGLVTNPEFVEAVVTELAADFEVGSVSIALPSTQWVDAERVGRFLGYDGIATALDVDLVRLDDADRTEETVHLTKESVDLQLPEILADATLVAIPTLRHDAEFRVAAGMFTLAQAVDEDPTVATLMAAARALDPEVTLLDGTYTYTGEPRKSAFLLACDDVVAMENAAARLLDLEREDVPHLDTYDGERRQPGALKGVSLRALAEGLPNKKPKTRESEGPMGMGYRLYAKVAGDAVPPQFIGGSDD